MIKRLTITGHPYYPVLDLDFTASENSENVFTILDDTLERGMFIAETNDDSLQKRQAINELLLIVKYLANKEHENSLISLTKSSNDKYVTLQISIEYYSDNELYKYYAVLSNGLFIHQILSKKKSNGLYKIIKNSKNSHTIFSDVEESYLGINNYFYDRNLHLSNINLPDVLEATPANVNLISNYCKLIVKLIEVPYIKKVLDQLISIMNIDDSFSTSSTSVITEIVPNGATSSKFPLDVVTFNNKTYNIKNYINESDVNAEMLILTLVLFVTLMTKDGVIILHNLDQVVGSADNGKYYKSIKNALKFCSEVKDEGFSSSYGMQFIVTLSNSDNLSKFF